MVSGGGDLEGTRSAILRQLNENAGKRRREVESTVQRNEKSLKMRSQRAYNGREELEGMEMGEIDEGRRLEAVQRDSEDEHIDIED